MCREGGFPCFWGTLGCRASVCSACLVAANPKPEIKTTKTNSISQESGGQLGMNSHLGTRKKKNPQSPSPSQSYERKPRHASFYLPISIYFNKPDPIPWVNRFLNYVSKAFFWQSPVILGHSMTVLKGRKPDVTITKLVSLRSDNSKILESKVLSSNSRF